MQRRGCTRGQRRRWTGSSWLLSFPQSQRSILRQIAKRREVGRGGGGRGNAMIGAKSAVIVFVVVVVAVAVAVTIRMLVVDVE